MKYGDEHHPLQGKFEAATFQQPTQNVRHANLLPKFLKHQRWAEMDGTARRDLIGLQRVQNSGVIT